MLSALLSAFLDLMAASLVFSLLLVVWLSWRSGFLSRDVDD
jgi:hypothetical protein